MVAEGISAALARYSGIVSLGATTAATDAERLGAQAYAVAIDPALPGALVAAGRLRRMGVRVVFLGDASTEFPGTPWITFLERGEALRNQNVARGPALRSVLHE